MSSLPPDLSRTHGLVEFATWEKRVKALPLSRPVTIRLQRLGRPRHTFQDMEFDNLNYEEFELVAQSLREVITWEVYGLRCVVLPVSYYSTSCIRF